MRTIDGDALLEKFAKLEAIALEYVGKLNERQDPNEHDMWVMWTGILNERTAYKYEIVDAPTVEAIPIEWLKEHIVTIEQRWILEDWEREHETDRI